MMEKIESVKTEVLVETSRERAFQVFVEGIDRWWPRSHHVGKSPLKKGFLEGKEGGRWYSICEDDSVVEIGKVLRYEPPGRLVLAWQLTSEWKFDASFVTEVEVTFVAEGPKTTRVQLEHRDLERYGETAGTLRKSISSPGGWPLILGNFAKDAAASEG
jgi:uncharacterized protein YndB with AHSA1/START domain